MSGRFVRASKYRHVFGRPTKKEQCYDNLRISKNAWDTNLVKANPLYLAVNWEASGGGAFAVVPVEERGKLPEQLPLFRGHTAAVLDTDWSPFDDSLIASGSDDGKVFIWRVPEGFTLHHEDPEDIEDVQPISKLTGHSRKVGHVLFNSSAKNVLASSSGDCTVKLWDIDAESSKLSLKHTDIVQSLSWNASGSLLVTTSRDKKLRVWDVRQEKPAVETAGHSGAKSSRAVWMGEHDRIATTGFSKMSDRQLGLWDARAAQAPINGFEVLDQISGICMPFWDEGTQCLYLAGKGDGNIRYFEYENDKFEYLSQHTSADPQRGIAFLPKRGVNLHENELTRAYRTVNDSYIEPVSFIVPRRAEVFQSDVYPPTVGLKASMSAGEWFEGKDGLPPKIDLESLFDGQAPTEVPADYKPPTPATPAAAKSSTPTKTASDPAKSAAETVVARGPPPSMKDNQTSIANMAARFADKDEPESSDDETSSFEEVSKPVERPTTATAAAASIPKPASEANGKAASQTKTVIETAKAPASAPEVSSAPAPTIAHRSTSSTSSTTPTGAAEGLKSHLQDIKAMLETQNETIRAQNDQLAALTKEVETLKMRGSNDSAKDEKIRMLELELEETRS